MTSLSVQIPAPRVDFVARRAAAKGFPSTDALHPRPDLAAPKTAPRARLEALLLEGLGLDSGEPIEVNEAFWEDQH